MLNTFFVVYLLGIFILIFPLIIYLLKSSPICNGGSGGSGSGCDSDAKKYNSIKLKRNNTDDIIGKGFHRSGWPKVIDYLSVHHSEKGILFDDFVEQTFCYTDTPPIYKEDWVGVFHHPDDIPYFGNNREKLKNLFKQKEFIESSKKLKLAIALSSKLGNYLRKHLDCEVVVLRHPVELDKFPEWDLNKWKDNKDKKIIQLGFYQRNTQLFNQIPQIDDISIKRIWRSRDWMENWDNKIKNYFIKKRKSYNMGTDLKFLTPSKFDNLMVENIIMTEYMSVSASNVIMDCISRNCPLIVNKKPEVVEYLGEDYPLYFNNPEEIPTMIDKIEAAHIYLKNLNKDIFSLPTFCEQLLSEINKIDK